MKVTLSCVLVMRQAALLDGSALDALTLQQDGLPPAEIDIGRGQVVQALVIPPVVVLLDKGLYLSLQRARQIVILQQDAVLHGLVPAFDLTPRLGMGRRTTDMLDAVPRQPLGEGIRDEPRPIVRVSVVKSFETASRAL
jgi:hypothetical protein